MLISKEISRMDVLNGIDVSIEITDSETGNVYPSTLNFSSIRVLKHDYENRINKAISNLAAHIADDAIKKEWSREELEVMLKDKGYLTETETVEDLKAAK